MNTLIDIAAGAVAVAVVWWARWCRHGVVTVPPHLLDCPTCRCDRQPVGADR